MADIESVNVALRVRPLVRSERERGCQIAVERVPGGAPQVVVNRSEPFTFNYVFDESDTQKGIYDACVADMLKKLLSGFNATILAYGQTGSGKTYTMGTAYNGSLDDDAGLIPRAIYDIFNEIEAMSDSFDFVVKCSFMELYQEQLFDLLTSNGRESSIVDLREDKTGIIIPGLTEKVVHSAQEVTQQLLRGSAGRAVASTAMNQQSSRSHAIFTITIVATQKNETKSVTTSKFHLVDLAGSERCTKTQATGDRFKEGVNINKGLLALGNVISALGAGQGSGFVRYRDSKLTRLLQDSLGGNSITLMIACVSPADYNVAETISTLRYANRARQIKNKPILNQDPHAAEINHLKDIIQKLRVELLSRGGGMSNSLSAAISDTGLSNSIVPQFEQHKLMAQIKELQTKNRHLQQQLNQTLLDSADNEMRAHISEAAHEKLKERNNELKQIVCQLESQLNDDSNEDHVKQIKELTRILGNIDEEHERTENEILTHKKQSFTDNESNNNGLNSDNMEDVNDLIQSRADEYTNIQININEELRLINRELDLKQDLHQRVCNNFNNMYASESNIEEKVRECEQKIQELESEKSELMDKLRHVKDNASAKLAEERRKRLQTLEQDISDMKRKILQQAKLLKVREKETQKIQNLSSEIRQMKESKVKLIRTMRQESEKFRRFKMVREQELMQLKNKDRKLQNEMARKEALHSKQRNVLKRKCEEAMAINKRLKDAIERQRVAQAQRQKAPKDSAKQDQTAAWVDREIDLILHLIDAEHSLEQLMEDRAVISVRINDIKSQISKQESDTTESLQKELTGLEDELDMRNAQIADLQQKVCVVDLETRMRTLCDGLQNLSELRTVVKQLLKLIVQMRRDQAQHALEQKLIMDEQKLQLQDAEERYQTAEKRIKFNEAEYKQHITNHEQAYEEKIAILLRTMPQVTEADANEPVHIERQKILDEQWSKMESELNYYRKLRTTRKYTNDDPKHIEFVESNEESDFDPIDQTSDDPDWRLTPIVRSRSKRSNERRKNNSGSSSIFCSDETFVTAASKEESITATNTTEGAPDGFTEPLKSNKLKRQSKGCYCRNNCHSKRCGCNTRNELCSLNCACKGNCHNNEKRKTNNKDDENSMTFVKIEEEEPTEMIESSKENVLPTTSDSIDSELVTSHKTEKYGSPKKAKMSLLTFNTPLNQQKFFK